MKGDCSWFGGMGVLVVVFATILLLECGSVGQSRAAQRSCAMLGVKTQVPNAELAEKTGIEPIPRIRPQQWRGRIIREIVPGSPAEEVGLSVGDAILEMSGNTLVSQDDFNDYIGVCKPGDEITLVVKKAGQEKPETIKVKLGKKPLSDADNPVAMTWHYAGLGQFKLALEEAEAEKKLVMVGLSGAET